MSVHAHGTPQKSGAYVLELALEAPLELSFGRFQGGRVFVLAPGRVYYVGSALAGRLPSRLLRHATRAAGPPHRLRAELLRYFEGLGWAVRPPARKTLHWHADHLMESPAELAAVYLFYGDAPREAFLEEALRALGAE
uniref:DUF123 domain-containing protein n=1 Tax=Oceanithermus sp. TaxID=2268145 RepID=UPI0025F82D77